MTEKYSFWLHHKHGNVCLSMRDQKFSITVAGGQHNRYSLLEHYQEFAPIVRMHGCDTITGAPACARDNAVWWLSGCGERVRALFKHHPLDDVLTCREKLQWHLRIGDDELEALVKSVMKPGVQAKAVRHRVIHKLKQLAPEWRWDATTTRMLIEDLYEKRKPSW